MNSIRTTMRERLIIIVALEKANSKKETALMAKFSTHLRTSYKMIDL